MKRLVPTLGDQKWLAKYWHNEIANKITISLLIVCNELDTIHP
jgi:hypothetical protein